MKTYKKKKSFAFRLREDQEAKLQAIATIEMETLSGALRKLIDNYKIPQTKKGGTSEK